MRLDRTRAAIREAGLSAIVATSFENVAYLGGVPILTQRLIPDRLAAVILPAVGEPTLVVCSIETAQIRKDSWIDHIVDYVEFAASPVAMIADVLAEQGLSTGRVGLETGVLTANHMEELRRHLPEAELSSIDDLMASVRARKEDHEIELLSTAAAATDQAIATAFDAVTPGTTERDIASQIAGQLLSGASGRAADSLAFIVVAAGPNAAIAHPSPTERPIEPGDLLRCDVGGYFDGYYSDVARTVAVGSATGEQHSVYERLAAAQAAVISAAVPGATGSDLFALCRDELEARQLELSLPHVGHSIGLGLHETPMLSPFDRTPLADGMVLAIEPAVKGPGGTFHIEDTVRVAQGGGRIVGRCRSWDRLQVVSGRQSRDYAESIS